MTELVSSVLAAAAQAEALMASTVVEKPIDLTLDLGNMLAFDTNVLENEDIKDESRREEYFLNLARDNTQILVNAIWSLPTERVEEVIVAKFPPPSTKLPREKPLPKPKEMTKWEKYAAEKGIVKKKKKDRLAWDDVVQKWVPLYGYKKVKVDAEKNWCIPLAGNADPDEDPYKKLSEQKSERVAKNELQRLRNLAKQKNVNLPSVGVVPSITKGPQSKISAESDDLKKTSEIVKASTASLGKFQEKLDKKLEQKEKARGPKRKFESNTGDHETEKSKSLNILQSITNKKSKLDIDMAVGKQIYAEDHNQTSGTTSNYQDSKTKAKKGGKGGGKTKRKKAHFANKGGKGKYTGKTFGGATKQNKSGTGRNSAAMSTQGKGKGGRK